jgi:hypothetical protein
MVLATGHIGLLTGAKCRISLAIKVLKSSSHGANWWRVPQPVAIRRMNVKRYTSIDNVLLFE